MPGWKIWYHLQPGRILASHLKGLHFQPGCRIKEYHTGARSALPKAAQGGSSDTETEALCARQSAHHSASSSQTGALKLFLRSRGRIVTDVPRLWCTHLLDGPLMHMFDSEGKFQR